MPCAIPPSVHYLWGATLLSGKMTQSCAEFAEKPVLLLERLNPPSPYSKHKKKSSAQNLQHFWVINIVALAWTDVMYDLIILYMI